MRQKVDELQLELSRKDYVIQELVGRLAASNLDLDYMRDKLDASNSVKAELDEKIESLENQLNESRDTAKYWCDRSKDLKQQLEKLHFDAIHTSSSSERLRIENERLSNTIQSLRKYQIRNCLEYSKVVKKLDESVSEVNELKQKLVSIENKLEKVYASREALEIELCCKKPRRRCDSRFKLS